jgi:hypothetical protein
MNKPFLRLLFRFLAAIFVACATSSLTFAIGMLIFVLITPVSFGDFPMLALMAIIGFVGVFSGTSCLESNGRRYGSIVLLGCGVGFSLWLWTITRYGLNPPQFNGFPPFFWPLLSGGLMAVIFFWLKPRKKKEISN